MRQIPLETLPDERKQLWQILRDSALVPSEDDPALERRHMHHYAAFTPQREEGIELHGFLRPRGETEGLCGCTLELVDQLVGADHRTVFTAEGGVVKGRPIELVTESLLAKLRIGMHKEGGSGTLE